MMGLITSYWVSQAVGVVALLGVADQLDEGPRGSDELARAVGADPQALYRVLRLLASLGVFAEAAPGSFALTPLGETLRSDAPDSVRNFAITETAPGHWLPWARLLESVRTGRPQAREALGMELFDWYARNPEEAGYFSAAMGNLSALAAGELVRGYDFSAARTGFCSPRSCGPTRPRAGSCSTCPTSSRRPGARSRRRGSRSGASW